MKGYIAIMTVLILAAVALMTSMTVALLSVGEAQTAFSLTKGEEAWRLVDGCVEDALLKSKSSASYSGGNITRSEGTCEIGVSKIGDTWTIVASPLSTKYHRTVEVVVGRMATGIVMLSWKEQ